MTTGLFGETYDKMKSIPTETSSNSQSSAVPFCVSVVAARFPSTGECVCRGSEYVSDGGVNPLTACAEYLICGGD